MATVGARRSLGQRIARDTVRASAASIVGQGLSLLVAAYCAAVFGATVETDAYYLAYALPLFATNVVREAIKMVLVPVVVEIRVQHPAEVRPAVASALSAVTALSCALALLLALIMPLLLPHMAAQMPENGQRLALMLLWESLPSLPLMCLAGVLAGILNAHHRFAVPMLVPGAEAVVRALLVLLLTGTIGIHSLVLGNVIGAGAGVLWLWLEARRLGLQPGFAARMHPSLTKMTKLAVLPLLGNSLLLLNPFVDRAVATRLEAGSITALSYAERINTLPWALIGASLFTVILSYWSQMVAEDDQGRLGPALQDSLLALTYLMVPLTVLFVVLRYPLVRLILERGHFDARATAQTALALGYLALGLVPYYVNSLLARAYLALQDTRTPVLLGIANAALNLTLDLALVEPLAIGGIALSSSLTLATIATVSAALLRRRLVGWQTGHLLRPLGRITLAGLAAAAAGYGALRVWERLLSPATWPMLAGGLAVVTLAALVVFLLASLALRLEQPRQIWGWMQHPRVREERA